MLELAPLALFEPLSAQSSGTTPAISASFPTQQPELVKEMVSVSHGNVNRVKELLKAQPSLAKASWDWGFGDWETSLGAASHVGNREIATLLLEQGAPPTIFSATMLGQLEVVKAMIAASPGLQKVAGPHGIPLLTHAKMGGEGSKAVLQYLESLGDAGGPPVIAVTREEQTAVAGTYTFGNGPNDRIEILTPNNQVQFKRAGSDARRLFHIGELAFYPAGANAVRIRFDGKGALTVADPDVILRAQRLAK